MTIYENSKWIISLDTDTYTARHKSTGKQYERSKYVYQGFGIIENQVAPTKWIALIEQADKALRQPTEDYMGWAIRVLAMIGELHKLGFQRLRFHTSNRGIGLRLFINSADRFRQQHGAEMIDSLGSVVYVSGMKNEYFDWKDATSDNARQLAAKFMVRFPELTQRGRGHDWAYAGWFQHMLGIAEQGYFPEVWVDWSTNTDEHHIYIGNAPAGIRLVKPPGGESKLIGE